MLPAGVGEAGPCLLLCLQVVFFREVGGAESTRRHGSVRSTVLRGEAGAGLGADVPGASPTLQGSLLTAGVSFSDQRAVGAKILWGVNRVSTLNLFTSGVYFK